MEIRPKYQAPYALDLSGFTVSGGKVRPMNQCRNGYTVYENACTAGTKVSGNTSSCDPFGMDVGTINHCEAGTGGESGCISGHTP